MIDHDEISLSGWTEGRVYSTNLCRYDVEYAHLKVTHEGASINFRESSKKMRGIEGEINASAPEIARIMTELINSMQEKILQLEEEKAWQYDFLMREVSKWGKLLEAAYDVIVRNYGLNCESHREAQLLVSQHAKDIEEVKSHDFEPA